MLKRNSRLMSFIIIIIMYCLAFAAAYLVYQWFRGMGRLPATLMADAAATVVIWLFGVAYKNSSTYDPYWSVAPVIMVVYWAITQGPLRFADILIVAALLLWGIRLTANWARRWGGLAHQDWRYTLYKQKMPRLWFCVNLFGIHLMPTVLVFLAMIPVYYGLASKVQVSLVAVLGFGISIAAVLIEFVADKQMDAYQKLPGAKSLCMSSGVWLWCRHPNYLGEILFWWGLWLMQMGLDMTWWTVIGPVLVTLLFVFVSIPMMEKHVLETRPEYERTIKTVPMLIPSPKKIMAGEKTPAQHH